MNPNKRPDQIEPVMADVLQKVDRLIEGHGQLVEMVVNTKAELKAAGESTARAVANLTVTTQKQYEELKAGQELLRAGQEDLKVSQEDLKASQQDLKASQEGLKASQEGLTANQELLTANQEDLKAGQADLKASQEDLKVGQAELKAGQELILQILREKLS